MTQEVDPIGIIINALKNTEWTIGSWLQLAESPLWKLLTAKIYPHEISLVESDLSAMFINSCLILQIVFHDLFPYLFMQKFNLCCLFIPIGAKMLMFQRMC